MDALGQFLDNREDARRGQAEADERWLRERAGIDPAERLLAWDRWVVRTLEKSLAWPADPAAKARLVRQCAAEVNRVARDLRGRGWLLDGEALVAHVRAMLAPIVAAQAAGKVGDFWPYFRAAVARYVGANAEHIQQQARRTGADEAGQAIGAVLGEMKLRGRSLTELLAERSVEVREAKTESLREKLARRRAQEKADRQQGTLL